MKLTLISQNYKPEIGASPNRLYELCIGLRDLGVDVSVITGMPNYPVGKIYDGYKGRFTLTEKIDDIEIKRYWLYASNAKKAFPRILSMVSFCLTVLLSFFYLLKRKNDYIIVESPPLPLAVSAMFMAKLTGARFVMNVSDLWPLSARDLGVMNGDGIAYKALEGLEKFLYRHSFFCMGQSQEIVDYISSRGAKSVYLFRNGVDPSRFEQIDRKTISTSSTIKIVYVGLLGYAQGIAGVCKNVDFKKSGAEFHIYGAGGEQKEIEEFLSAHPDKNIYYHGKVSREDVPRVLSECDCTLVPLVKNIYGAVPSKIYESMAAGLPILFSGDGEGKRLVEENNVGWTSAPLDFQTLETNIKSISCDRSEWQEKKQNCVKCANEKFNRPKQIKTLYEFFLSGI